MRSISNGFLLVLLLSISNKYLTHKSCKNKIQMTDLWSLKIAEEQSFYLSVWRSYNGARELNQMSWVLVNQWDNECYYYIAHIWRVAMCNNVGKSVMLSLLTSRLQDFLEWTLIGIMRMERFTFLIDVIWRC